eukprot:CCRYP_018701-RA/>CCRYP_018701-RA protein AED:0.21 eAED:0.26 QI:0/-1/0/1/-1/1/1/0/236
MESSPFHDIFESKGRSHWARRPSHSGGASYSTSNRAKTHAGENLKFYISNCLKKPNKVQFVQCVMQLNNYVEDLLCLYYSLSASTMTQQVYSFTDAELACHILRMCLLKWQDQYHLLEKCYPGVKPLLLILERIEVAHPVDERQSLLSLQRPKELNSPPRSPKKPKQARTEYTHVDKNCKLCKRMGAHTMHNTAGVSPVQQRRNSREVLRASCTKVPRGQSPQEVLRPGLGSHGET